MLRVIALWMVSRRLIVVMPTATLAAYGTQRKNRRYEHQNNDSPNVAHLPVSLVRTKRVLATPRRRRIDVANIWSCSRQVHTDDLFAG